MNTGAPTTDRFEDRLLAAILDDFDNLTAATPATGPTGLVRHQRTVRLTPKRVVPALAATAAAAVVAVAVVAAVGSGGGGHAPAQTASGPGVAGTHGATQAQLVAYRLASASAAAPATQGRYVVLQETDTETGQGQSQRTTVVDTQTGASRTYQQLPAGSGAPPVLTEGPDPTSTEAWFAALPTDPTALRTQLLDLAKQQAAQAATTMEQQPAQAGKTLPTNAGQPTLSDDDSVYQEADTLLWSPLVQPDLRAALYKVLAATGGYTVDTNATDPAGRSAIAMTRTYSGVPETDVTYEDPATGAVLAQVWKDGTNTTTAVYQPVTSADTIPPTPIATDRPPTRAGRSTLNS